MHSDLYLQVLMRGDIKPGIFHHILRERML